MRGRVGCGAVSHAREGEEGWRLVISLRVAGIGVESGVGNGSEVAVVVVVVGASGDASTFED